MTDTVDRQTSRQHYKCLFYKEYRTHWFELSNSTLFLSDIYKRFLRLMLSIRKDMVYTEELPVGWQRHGNNFGIRCYSRTCLTDRYNVRNVLEKCYFLGKWSKQSSVHFCNYSRGKTCKSRWFGCPNSTQSLLDSYI